MPEYECLVILKTDLFFVCYSVVSQSSVEELKRIYLPSLQPYLNKKNGIILIGTKIDLRNDPDVIEEMEGPVLTYEDGLNFAEEIGAIGYVECSAKTGENLDNVFEEAFRFCLDKRRNYNDPSYTANNYKIIPPSKGKSARK